jgi:two-component system nitrogen regulation sensor histidine kinase NtrY
MNELRRRLVLYLVALHLLLFGLVLVLLRERPLFFIGLELVLVLSFVLGLRLVRRALEPLGYTERLRDLLQDQDYAARLRTDGSGELGQLIALFNNLLSHLHTERLKIGEQQGFLDRLLEATPSAVIVFDFDGNISLINACAQALLQLEAAQGKPLRAWLDGSARLHPGASAQQRARSLALLEQLEHLPSDASAMLNDPDGRRYRGQRGHFYDRGFARHFLMVEELTQELQSSERATYEKLVRVLGHEVNNTVAATGSVLDSLLYYRSQLAERDGEDFSTAIVAVKRRNTRLGEFIERFTHVVKLPEPERRPCQVQDVVEDILWLYREPCRSRGINIGWRRRDAVPALALDSQLLEQALQNLVKNAMEAAESTMQEHGRDQGYVQLELASEQGGVRLSVIDSGGRLGAVPASQLFTPFFTTKKGGQGIGLLLVREVLTRHGCAYRLAANADGDTSFDIWLQAPTHFA